MQFQIYNHLESTVIKIINGRNSILSIYADYLIIKIFKFIQFLIIFI